MKGNIPQETTSFVGRRPELTRLGAALATHRLITLTGAGGVGKTRLAQRAAAGAGFETASGAAPTAGRPADSEPTAGSGPAAGFDGAAADRPFVAARFPDGTWWADLATLDSPDLLLATVSDAVDLADHSPRMPVEALCEWLADKRLLLVLDSCEHLADECGHLVAELLAAAPGLTVLATSRRPLGSHGEQVFDVAPLSAGGEDARALFTARVTARLGPAALAGPGAAGAAESICRRLEGIPLAIELAAAQVGPADVTEVAARLGSRFEVLARSGFVWPRRHQTLRTAIGWSHELCAPLERLLWARLSVFRGAFDLAAAQAVTAGGPLAAEDVAPTLERLVAQSVVGKAGSGDRYRMLDTIREYGHEWLLELGETGPTADRHATYFAGLARWADDVWAGTGQLPGYRAVEDAHPDLRTALDHWLVRDPAKAAELAGLLVYFWTCCGHIKEARGYLDRALAAHTAPGPARTRALTGLGITVTLQGDYDLATRLSAEVRDAAEADGVLAERLGAAALTGLLGMLMGRPQTALDAVQEALKQAPDLALDSPDRLRCDLVEVLSLTALGSLAEGRARALALREHCVRTGEVWTRSYLDYQLSIVALLSGEPAEAVDYARTMLESKRMLGDAFGIALGLDLLAAALAADGRAEQAASVYGTGEAYWRSVGHPQRGAPELRVLREQCEATARAALGDTGYTAAYTRGALGDGRAALAEILKAGPPGLH
ncbi:ATP-binding protein [Actinacidiphila sp. ITFR-21]|uniref:ATP-binding protein n=1 Tax=Actinacidiphila sp. ITFR-21 TaxID=3075199 RepID=UPI0028893D0B|nr:regulator [Streptomyces sp. ITFR-21]WNI19035.1 regulator [Streptomyces sp. ITFR-21]